MTASTWLRTSVAPAVAGPGRTAGGGAAGRAGEPLAGGLDHGAGDGAGVEAPGRADATDPAGDRQRELLRHEAEVQHPKGRSRYPLEELHRPVRADPCRPVAERGIGPPVEQLRDVGVRVEARGELDARQVLVADGGVDGPGDEVLGACGRDGLLAVQGTEGGDEGVRAVEQAQLD